MVDSKDFVYLNYDKVRIKCNINDSKVKFNGYINQVKDSSVCYRFWGPLGFELGRGRIDDNFTFYDAINHQNYPDIKSKLENISGLLLNKHIFLELLSGNTQNLERELNVLNKDILRTLKIGSDILEIENNISKRKVQFKYKYQNDRLKYINIKSTGFQNIFELNLEIVEISHMKKICKF